MKKLAVIALCAASIGLTACASRYYYEDRYAYYQPRGYYYDRDGIPYRYDRDRDGVPNYADRAPYNPYRY